MGRLAAHDLCGTGIKKNSPNPRFPCFPPHHRILGSPVFLPSTGWEEIGSPPIHLRHQRRPAAPTETDKDHGSRRRCGTTRWRLPDNPTTARSRTTSASDLKSWEKKVATGPQEFLCAESYHATQNPTTWCAVSSCILSSNPARRSSVEKGRHSCDPEERWVYRGGRTSISVR